MVALRDGDVHLFVCSFVRLSPVKFVKSFARWQHLAASEGAYRIDSDTYRATGSRSCG